MNKEILIKLINQGLSTWKIAEKLSTNQTQVRNWLKQHNLKTNRSLVKKLDEKICPKCKQLKKIDNFYQSFKSSSYCKDCISKHNTLNRQYVKQQSVDYLGGKCSKCGYDKCIAALEFHHLDPKEKDVDYANYKWNFNDKLKAELDKCVLLCANCHREEHHLH